MKAFCFFSLALALLLAPIAYGADISAKINTGIPGSYGGTTRIAGIVANFYQFGLLVAGLLAFGVIVYGGILYAISGANPEQQKEARKWITNAIWGLLLLASATVLLNIINPELTKLRINPFPGAARIQESSGITGLGGPSGPRYGCTNEEGITQCSITKDCADVASCREECKEVSRGACGCPAGEEKPYYALISGDCVKRNICGVTTEAAARQCSSAGQTSEGCPPGQTKPYWIVSSGQCTKISHVCGATTGAAKQRKCGQ